MWSNSVIYVYFCRKIIDEAIAANEVPAYDAYINEPIKKRNKRKRMYEKEAMEAKKIRMTELMAAAGETLNKCC